MLNQNPEMFSSENIAEIRAKRSSKIDNQWIKYNSAHVE
ncbi:hypothetical protein [Sphingobacterium mizutaii]